MARRKKIPGPEVRLAIDTPRLPLVNEEAEDDKEDDEEEWKVGWYGGNHAKRGHHLLPEELEAATVPSLFDERIRVDLADRFKLTSAQVNELARCVEEALDPDLNPLALSVGAQDGTSRGTAAIERGFKALSDAQERLTTALEELVRLRLIEPDSDASDDWRTLVSALDHAQSGVLASLAILDQSFRNKDLLFKPVTADRRQVGAARRTLVLRAVIDFWVRVGRRPSFTTRPNGAGEAGQYRSGPLLDLCGAVIKLARKNGRGFSEQVYIEAITAWNQRDSGSV